MSLDAQGTMGVSLSILLNPREKKFMTGCQGCCLENFNQLGGRYRFLNGNIWATCVGDKIYFLNDLIQP